MTARKTLASQLPAVAGRPRTVPALPPTFSKRAGVTLIELLVVISVLLILTAVAVPLIQPLLAGREVREAARMVNTYLAAAQSRAVEIGRPVGVWIERDIRDPSNPTVSPTQINASLQLFIAEVPPPYAGDSVDARATIDDSSTPPPTPSQRIARLLGASLLENLGIGQGDFIKFDYQGPVYPIDNVDYAMSDVTFNILAAGAPYANPASVPYQIFRRPRKTSAAPLQLPTSTVIDLTVSGIGADEIEFNQLHATENKPVIITFAPNGRLDYAYYNNGTTFGPQRLLGSVHLLVGRLDQLGPGNLSDLENRWVSISHTTGNVSTSENAGLVGDDNANGGNGDGTITPGEARLFALDKLGMGGR